MKVKNIMFSGFAAAILMGTAQAATTPFEIASKAYVDGKFSTASSAASTVAETVGDLGDLNPDDDAGSVVDGATSVVGALDALDEALATKQDKTDSTISAAQASAGNHLIEGSGVAGNLVALDSALGTAEGKIDSLEEAVNGDGTNPGLAEIVNGDPEDQTDNGLVGRVGALENTMGTGTMTVSGATQSDVIAAINALDTKTNGIATAGNLQQLETTVGTKQDRSDSTVAAGGTYNHITAGSYAVGTNLANLDSALGTAEGAISTLNTQINGDPNDATDGLAGDVAALQTALNGDANTDGLSDRLTAAEGDIDDLEATMGTGTLTGFSSGVDTVIAALNDLQSNKLNKPIPNSCTAQSQHCVLHMDNTGALSWVDITVPYVETSGNNEEPAGGGE